MYTTYAAPSHACDSKFSASSACLGFGIANSGIEQNTEFLCTFISNFNLSSANHTNVH